MLYNLRVEYEFRLDKGTDNKVHGGSLWKSTYNKFNQLLTRNRLTSFSDSDCLEELEALQKGINNPVYYDAYGKKIEQ